MLRFTPKHELLSDRMKSYYALNVIPIIGSKLWVNWLAAFIAVENDPLRKP